MNTVLLHCCCAPCSSACLERLKEYFKVTVLFYNPNIDEPEYSKRKEELKRFISQTGWADFIDCDGEQSEFYSAVKGLESCPEGGERCFLCYEMRLREAASLAKKQKFDYFTTTLSISPLKDADKLNEIGERLSKEYGVLYLYSDFKKKNGYKRSVELSKEYGMYRQYYCGCVYSKRQRDEEIAEKNR